MAALWPDTFVEEGDKFSRSRFPRCGRPLERAGRDGLQRCPSTGTGFQGEVVAPSPTEPTSATPDSAAPILAVTPVRKDARWSLATVFIVTMVALGFTLRSGKRRARSTTTQPRLRPRSQPTRVTKSRRACRQTAAKGRVLLNGPKQDNYDIYVNLRRPWRTPRADQNPARDDRPARSPDGGRIAFLRPRLEASQDLAGKEDLFVIPALGGAERRVATIVTSLTNDYPMNNLAWTPDGKWLAIGGRLSLSGSSGIWLFEVDGPASGS